MAVLILGFIGISDFEVFNNDTSAYYFGGFVALQTQRRKVCRAVFERSLFRIDVVWRVQDVVANFADLPFEFVARQHLIKVEAAVVVLEAPASKNASNVFDKLVFLSLWVHAVVIGVLYGPFGVFKRLGASLFHFVEIAKADGLCLKQLVREISKQLKINLLGLSRSRLIQSTGRPSFWSNKHLLICLCWPAFTYIGEQGEKVKAHAEIEKFWTEGNLIC